MTFKPLHTLLLFLLLASSISHFALAGKRKVHITDDLDDVFDDEEDDAWKEWGKKPGPSFPPSDISKMDPSQIQEEMKKRHAGPVIGFVKLRFGVRRTPVSTLLAFFSVLISVCPFDIVAVCFRILVKFVIFCDFADTLIVA